MNINIIDGRQKKHIRVVEGMVTITGWLLMLGFAMQVILSLFIWYFNISEFYSKLFMIYNLAQTIHVVFITLFISLLGLSFIYLWGRYNLNKYGSLKRRAFPKDTTVEELAEFFKLPPQVIHNMQQSKTIILEKTIV